MPQLIRVLSKDAKSPTHKCPHIWRCTRENTPDACNSERYDDCIGAIGHDSYRIETLGQLEPTQYDEDGIGLPATRSPTFNPFARSAAAIWPTRALSSL